KVTEAKPAEAPKPTEVKAEEKPTDAPPAEVKPAELAPVEYKYTLPENIKMDDALKGEFHTALDAYRKDPTNPQALIDMHNEQMGNYHDHLIQEQHRVFAETRAGWRKEIMGDPELGGAGHQTAAQAVARMRDMFVS